MPTSLEQATVSTESPTLIGKLRHGEDDGRHSATHLVVLVTKNPGLPLTTALQSPFKGLRYSTEAIAVGSELEMFRISKKLLPTSSSQMFSGGNILGSFAGPAATGQHIVISGQK